MSHSMSCKNDMSNKYGGAMKSYSKKKPAPKAYATMKPRKGGMKKPKVSKPKMVSYRGSK
jgi:hypothetical protein